MWRNRSGNARKEYLQQVRKEMECMAEELKLEFNEKTQIFPISEGVDFLGFRFYLTDSGKVIKRLRTSNKKRWKRRLKKFQEDYRNETKTMEEIKRSIVSYRGHLSHGHTYKLRKKVMAGFVLTKAPKSKEDSDETKTVKESSCMASDSGNDNHHCAGNE